MASWWGRQALLRHRTVVVLKRKEKKAYAPLTQQSYLGKCIFLTDSRITQICTQEGVHCGTVSNSGLSDTTSVSRDGQRN